MSEIKIMSFNFAPKGWAQCNGQLTPINQNQALFSLLGTMYGGNGQTNFALPNLQGQVPIHIGSEFNVQGQAGGEQAHTLIQSEMPQHIHFLQALDAGGTLGNPKGNLLAQVSNAYVAPAGNLTTLSPPTVANAGGSQAHNNMQPYLVLNFCIALQGVFPSRN
jgi:microcystin-dependent protein